MIDLPEANVTFDGATGPLRGRVRPPASGKARGALVVCHGRHEDMDGPLVSALARLASEEGLWTLRLNFAFREADTEPSAGHADEIADLVDLLWGEFVSSSHLPEGISRGFFHPLPIFL